MAAAVQGHKSNGALQPRVTEQLGGAVEECEGHSTLLIAFNCVICLFCCQKSFFMLMYRLQKESIACIPSHHHTVHSGTDVNSCHLCALARSKKGRRQSRTPRFKQRPGEQTVFSVGR